jgi:hypothetical protein
MSPFFVGVLDTKKYSSWSVGKKSPNVIMLIKSRRMRWAEHVARVV